MLIVVVGAAAGVPVVCHNHWTVQQALAAVEVMEEVKAGIYPLVVFRDIQKRKMESGLMAIR